jgi:cystathionine beta-lyase
MTKQEGPSSPLPDDLDFDRWHDRKNTESIKWEFQVRDGQISPWDRTDADQGEERVLPMWVADMDFQVAKPIREAVQKRAAHGLYGYAYRSEDYLTSVAGWMSRRQGWHTDTTWIVPTPGVVPAIHLMVRRFTERGDKILIQRPVYHPFTYAAVNNDRVAVSNSLVLANGRYEMDFDDLREKTADPAVKLAVLCSPHSPVGRVWSMTELTQFAEICTQNDVLIVADEIHSDLIMPGVEFAAFGNLDDELLQNTIICTAPSKSFNLAGLQTSNLIIRNATLREGMQAELHATGLFTLNPFGLVATRAAYDESQYWLDKAIAYIDANLDLLETYIARHIPSLCLIRPQGTYLAWVDCRGVGLSTQALGSLMMDDAKVYLDEGHVFGVEGEGFMRFNVACPRSLLETALERIRTAVETHVG